MSSALEQAMLASQKEAPNPSDAYGLEIEPLVIAAMSGDQAAFRGLVEAFQRPLFYVVMRYLKNEADALDLVQGVLVKAYRDLASLQNPRAFKSWLFRIAVNLSLNAIRDNRKYQHDPIEEHFDLGVEAKAEDRIQQKQQWSAVLAATERLSPMQRKVLLLKLEADLSHSEIAQALDASVGAIRVHYHNAVKRLRAILSEGEVPQKGKST